MGDGAEDHGYWTKSRQWVTFDSDGPVSFARLLWFSVNNDSGDAVTVTITLHPTANPAEDAVIAFTLGDGEAIASDFPDEPRLAGGFDLDLGGLTMTTLVAESVSA